MRTKYNLFNLSLVAFTKIINFKAKYNLCSVKINCNAYYVALPVTSTLCVLLYVK